MIVPTRRRFPSFVAGSGYGLHVVYLLERPAEDKAAWKTVQRAMVSRWADLGADHGVATDESRVLRLVPYPNRKRWPHGVPTSLLYQSEAQYALTDLVALLQRSAEAWSQALASGGRAQIAPSRHAWWLNLHEERSRFRDQLLNP